MKAENVDGYTYQQRGSGDPGEHSFGGVIE